eukprot:g33364.t1
MQRQCRTGQAGKVRLLPLLCVLTLLALFEARQLSFLNRNNKKKVLFSARGYELVAFPSKGKVPIPSLKFRKIPLKPLTLAVSGSAEGSFEKSALTGFPYSTDNAAALLLGLPRLGGRLTLGMDAPAVNSESEDSNHVEAGYEQSLPGGGSVAARLRSNGEWGASFRHEVEDVGIVSGGLNSQLDWNLDLNTTYAPVRGFTPSNIPGKYSPVDFVHDSTISFTAGRHTIQASAAYDRQMLKSPLTGTLAYTLQTRPVTLQALMDGQQYALAAHSGRKSIAATLGRPNEEGQRSSQVQLQLGQVAATVKMEGSSKPRLRLSKIVL